MAGALEEALRSEGWHLKQDVMYQFADNTTSGKKSRSRERDVVDYVVNQDLLEVGEKYIKDKLNSGNDLLVGPCVLQIIKVRNISAPKENEESSFAPRMLKLTLTDGNSSVCAVETERIDALSLHTPPGTKVKLIGSVPFSSGHLHLQSSCIKVLGGRVEKLYTKWQVARETARFTRNTGIDGGPPPFIAFGQRPRATQNSSANGSKKSLKDPKKEGSENTEFSEQRKAAIAEVAKTTGTGKKFSTDNKASFGKKTFQQPDVPPNSNTGQFVQEQKIETPHSKGMYRELSTESGENVHEKTVGEFVEMGFKRDDVILCLRKNNNEFEATMDMLVELGSRDEVTNSSDSRRGRGRMNRGGRTRGTRGGHRNRHGKERDPPEQDENIQSAPATLFDFLESKMPSASVVNNPQSSSHGAHAYKHQDYTSSSTEWNPGKRNGPDFNTSERSSGYTGHFSQRGERAKRGGRGGRTDGNRGRGAGFVGRYSNNSHGDGNYSEHKGQSYNDSSYQRGKRYNTNARKNFRNDHGDVSSDNQPDSRYRNKGTFRPQGEVGNHRPYNHENGNMFKGRTNPGNGSYNRNRRNDGDRNSGRTDDNPNLWSHSEPVTDGRKMKTNDGINNESEAFPGFSQNPPPTHGPATTFGQPPEKIQYPSAPPTSATPRPYLQPANQAGPRVSVTLPRWQKGSPCLAKYWEDSGFYEAVVTDIHPTANTAVVQFNYFNNYEEVKLHDLKPLPFGNGVNMQGSHINASYGPPKGMSPPHGLSQYSNQEQAERLHKPAKALYVPPAQRRR